MYVLKLNFLKTSFFFITNTENEPGKSICIIFPELTILSSLDEVFLPFCLLCQHQHLYMRRDYFLDAEALKCNTWLKHQLFSSWAFTMFTPLPPDAMFWWLLHFPDNDFWRLVYSAVIWACLFCLYTIITAQVATCMLTIYDCNILKLDITWLTCVINKTKHWIDLPKFKMATRCTRCIIGFKTGVLGIIFTNSDAMRSILVTNDLFRKGLWDFNE